MSENKRIAFLCHPYHRGGVTRWMVDAAVAAAGSGYSVYFITVTPKTTFRSSGGREAIVDLLAPNSKSVKIITSKVGSEFEFGTNEYRAHVYSSLVQKHVPANTPVVVSDDKAVWMGAAIIADVYPMVGVLHCDDQYYYEIGKEYRNQLSLCICVSERVKRTFAEQCPGFDGARLFTIPCGINLPEFKPVTTTGNVANLCFIGRFRDHQKRAYDLVKIAAALRSQGFPFQLHIAGNDEASKAEFISSLAEQGVADLVTFHGWLSAAEVNRLLSNSDILLLTSNFEGTPLVMMEALAAGCGFTGTRVSGIEDYEHHQFADECFSVYAVGDIDDAVKKIKRVAAIPAVARQKAARKIAEEEFTMQVCLDKYFKALSLAPATGITSAGAKLSIADKLYSRAIALARSVKVSLKGK